MAHTSTTHPFSLPVWPCSGPYNPRLGSDVRVGRDAHSAAALPWHCPGAGYGGMKTQQTRMWGAIHCSRHVQGLHVLRRAGTATVFCCSRSGQVARATQQIAFCACAPVWRCYLWYGTASAWCAGPAHVLIHAIACSGAVYLVCVVVDTCLLRHVPCWVLTALQAPAAAAVVVAAAASSRAMSARGPLSLAGAPILQCYWWIHVVWRVWTAEPHLTRARQKQSTASLVRRTSGEYNRCFSVHQN